MKKTLISFSLSFVLHVAIIVAISIQLSGKDEVLNLVKLPNAIALNMNGRGGTQNSKKGSGPAQPKAQSTESVSGKTSGTAINPTSNTTAAGSGEVGSGGEAGSKNGVAGGTGDVEAAFLSAKQKYLIEFRSQIENRKDYPLMARKRGLQGIVVVGVTIKNNGEVIDHKIIKDSGHEVLDQAALNLVKKIQTFKAFPAEMGNGPIELKFPIEYKLNS